MNVPSDRPGAEQQHQAGPEVDEVEVERVEHLLEDAVAHSSRRRSSPSSASRATAWRIAPPTLTASWAPTSSPRKPVSRPVAARDAARTP